MAGSIRIAVLFAAVTLSGAAALMYQVAWTRRLITVTSATATSQALVLAIFMAGLGVGSWLGGRAAIFVRRPGLCYAAVEALAALLACGSMPLVAAVPLPAVIALFLMVTTLLGMSLPLLIEATLSGQDALDARGRIVSALYGLNTIGAAAGCLLAAYVTLERAGLTVTVWSGAGLAVVAAAMVLAVARQPGTPVARSEARNEVGWRWLVAAFVAGAVGLGAEVAWTRMVGLLIPNTVYSLSQVLAAVLIGIAAGAAIANRVARHTARASDPAAFVRQAAGLLAGFGAVLVAMVPVVVVGLAGMRAEQRAVAAGQAPLAMLGLFALLALSSACVSALLPLFVLEARGMRGSQAFSVLYATNTAGCLVGSLLAGFVLLPAFGVRITVTVCMAMLLAMAAVLLWRDRFGRRVLIPVALSCGLFAVANDLPLQIYQARIDPDWKILEFHEGVESNVMVTEDKLKGRKLWIGSIWVAGQGGPHSAFGHVPGLLVEKPRRILGIALGTGQTFAAVFKHGATHFDCVEIDAGVVAMSRKWFGGANRGLLDDPRVTVHVEDGRAFMRDTNDKYDLIVLEPLQSWTVGTTNLYTKEFYEEARRILAPGGVIAQWIPFYGQGTEETRAMVRTGLEVFAHGTLWRFQDDGLVVYSEHPASLGLAALDERIRARGIVDDLRPFPARGGADLLSFLLLGEDGLASWTRGADVLVDDRPFLEYRAARQIGGGDKFRPILASIRPHLDDLTVYAAAPGDKPLLAAAGRTRRALLELEFLPPGDVEKRAAILEAAGEGVSALLPWRTRYAEETFRWATQVNQRDPDGARTILQRAQQRLQQH